MNLFALIVAALAVGLGNFGAAVSIGMSGAAATSRFKVGFVFGLFEAGMPLVGLLLGHGSAGTLGAVAGYAGGTLLIIMGGWQVVREVRSRGKDAKGALPAAGMWRLLLAAFALSMDNLVVGFTLGAKRAPLALAIIVFAVVSVVLSVLGFELGRRLSAAIDFGIDYLAGFVLVGVGVLVTVGKF